ncbi:MAG: TonB-dependent receptor [Chitinophagaceae bacterium]|nr:TonB-dependent receptor [Chitinophagaceae bacterium]
MRFPGLVLINSLFLSGVAAYTQPPDSLSSLDPVVVSASFSPAQSSKTGRNIIVVKGEQIMNLPVNSVDELLRYLPGLEVQARGPMGVQGDISIRGSTFQQVLVVLDGIRINDPLTGHFNSYIPLPATEIERIEILKGAASAIYGTEAVGGVVHIITKTFARTANKSGFEGQFTAGESGLWGINAGGRWVNEKTTLSAGILTNNADGQPQRGTTGFFNLTTLSLGLSQKLNEHWTLGVRTAYDNRDFSAQNFYTTFVSDTATEQVESWWQHAQLTYNKGRMRFTTDIGYKSLQDIYAFNKASVANNNKTQLFQVLSRAGISIHEKLGFTAGVQYIDRGIKSNDRGDHQVWQAAVFGVLNWEPIPGLQIDPAIRFDQHERAGFEFVPQLNVSYRKNKYQLRGSAGRSVRDADFTERFNNYNRQLVTSGRIGNPDLEAESGWNYEAGADVWIGKGLKLSSTLFYRDQQKLIDWVNTPYTEMPRQDNLVPTGTYALSKNIWEVNTLGWELDLQYRKEFDNKRSLNVQGGLLWVDNNGNEGIPSLYLSTQAKWLANFLIQYQMGKFVVSATGLYKKREEQKTNGGINATLSPEYFVLNPKIEFNASKKWGVFVQVDNVTDKTYSDILGAAMPGRWWMGGVNVRF